MKVTLDIGNDKELRNHIKDCVRGQVLSIVREDFLEIVKEELNRKLKGVSEFRFESMMKAALTEAIAEICRKEHNVKKWDDSFIKPFVDTAVHNAIQGKDWNKLVDQLAKEKVKALLK